MEKRVAIIGAGISGLLACKYTLSKGFHPIVFEAQNQIGGVWTQTIESTILQNAKPVFEFSDFPWPSSVEEMFPHNTQVLEYIQSYAQHFQLLQYIKFNSKVISMDYVGEIEQEMESWELWGGDGKAFGSKGKWNLNVLDIVEGSTKEYVAEFMIICNGKFSGLPNIPEFPPGHGSEVFSGKVLHSMDYSALDNATAASLIKGKRIAVIGSSKSAVDISFECANANGIEYPCIMIQRTTHWMLPDVQPWGVNFGYLCFNRFYELMVHKPGEGFFYSVLATLFSPLRWGISKFIESYLRYKLPLKKFDMVPKYNFVQAISSCRSFLLPDKFYDKVEEGSIMLKRLQSFRFCKEGLVLDGDNDHPIKADIVIFATGYRGDEKLKNLFDSPTFQNCILGSSNSTVPLYRQMIHPRIPQLAVVGYSESLTNLYTFEMGCQWLSFFLDQTFQLPSIKEMEMDVKMWENHIKRYGGNNDHKSCVAGVHIWYNDKLCKDIGCNPRRKKGFFSEWFEPYGLADYKGLAPNS